MNDCRSISQAGLLPHIAPNPPLNAKPQRSSRVVHNVLKERSQYDASGPSNLGTHR